MKQLEVRKMIKEVIKRVFKRILPPAQYEILRRKTSFYRRVKCSAAVTFKGVSYIDIYEKYLNSFKHEPVNLLEIGVLEGDSLRLWKRYFPKGNIFGLDIDPNAKQYEEDRIFIEIGAQTDENVLSALCDRAKNFDIIIDDGSHVNKFTVKSFEYLFKRLKSGGIYIIEDLACSYERLEEVSTGDGRKGVREIWPGMKYNNPDENLNNNREEMDEFFRKIIYNLDHQQGDVLALHFWSMLAVIIKA